jgi:6-phosphogluconolactonase (cycloisomerase 2 family)
VLRVEPHGLTLVDNVSSGGDRPTSLTVHNDLLYVLNAGAPANITGFTVGHDGRLAMLAGSTRLLASPNTTPAQVQFSPDGAVLVVVERAANMISTFIVGKTGYVSGPNSHASAGNGPFGFDFDKHGHLIVSETAGAPGGSAASSYDVSPTGMLTTLTASAPTNQLAACWVVVTKNGRYAYTANAASGSISGFAIGKDGRLSLLAPDGRTAVVGAGSAPIDMAISNNGRYLYVLGNGSHMISGFRIGEDGSLTAAASAGPIVAGAAGMAAR